MIQVPDRRTWVVLGSLIGAMTLGGGLLLLLEPGPIRPLGQISLSTLVAKQGHPSQDVLFDPTRPIQAGRWSAIIIYDSGTFRGSASSLNRDHVRLGIGGLGYHFVVNNSHGAPDGQIEIGFRWQDQLVGAHANGPNSRWLNEHTVGICLIGDTSRQHPTDQQLRNLVWLIHQLQSRLGIPADRVVFQPDADRSTGDGRLFPVGWFRQQLLTDTGP